MSDPITDVKLSALDLNLLWALRVVLAEGSVAAAARRLNVTPAAVSNALARLREALGDPLLVRHGRGLAPTPRALALRPALDAAFDRLEAALTDGVPFRAADSERTFRLALSDGEQTSCLPAIAAAFVRDLPRARLEIVSVDALVASGGLGATDVDAAIAPLGEPGLCELALFQEDAVLVARADHPALAGGSAALLAERQIDVHLALGRGGRGHAQAEEAMSAAGIRREVGCVVPTFSAALRVAAATHLVAGCPRRVAEALAPSLGLSLRPFPGPFSFRMGLTWHPRADLDPGSRVFRALIVRALADVIA